MEPYSVIQAGCKLEDGKALNALQKTKSRFTDNKKDPMAFMRAFGRGGAPSEKACATLKKCAPHRLCAACPLAGFTTTTV